MSLQKRYQQQDRAIPLEDASKMLDLSFEQTAGSIHRTAERIRKGRGEYKNLKTFPLDPDPTPQSRKYVSLFAVQKLLRERTQKLQAAYR